MRYLAISRCVDPGCHCDDRRGIILYDGNSRDEATAAESMSPSGYDFSMSRPDGLDNVLSPNGPHPLYFVCESDGTKHGPYGCLREAELAQKSDDAVIVDHNGRRYV